MGCSSPVGGIRVGAVPAADQSAGAGGCGRGAGMGGHLGPAAAQHAGTRDDAVEGHGALGVDQQSDADRGKDKPPYELVQGNHRQQRQPSRVRGML